MGLKLLKVTTFILFADHQYLARGHILHYSKQEQAKCIHEFIQPAQKTYFCSIFNSIFISERELQSRTHQNSRQNEPKTRKHHEMETQLSYYRMATIFRMSGKGQHAFNTCWTRDNEHLSVQCSIERSMFYINVRCSITHDDL